jgi:serine/threonine protein kinase
MRFTSNNSSSNDPNAIPIPGGISPLFVAPEYFRGSSGAWDGFAADLWAAGLMLYSMVVGIDALFAAPVTEDTTFVALCIDGKIRETVNAYAETSGKAISLTDDLVELLEKMLKADPKQRYSLDDVIGHRWVKIADVD